MAKSKKDMASTRATVLINDKQLSSLLRQCTSIGKQTAELTGSLREKIGYAVEKHGLHKGAFADLRKYDKMEPEKLLEHWTTLLAYMDKAGITERMNSVIPMDLKKKDKEDGVGGEPVELEAAE